VEKIVNNKYISLIIVLKDLFELAADAKGYLTTGVFAANHFDLFDFLLHLFVAGWIYLLIQQLNKQKADITAQNELLSQQKADIAAQNELLSQQKADIAAQNELLSQQKADIADMLVKMKEYDVIFRFMRKDRLLGNINFSGGNNWIDEFTDEEKEVLAKHGYISKDYKH
jgi:hypothetical protein